MIVNKLKPNNHNNKRLSRLCKVIGVTWVAIGMLLFMDRKLSRPEQQRVYGPEPYKLPLATTVTTVTSEAHKVITLSPPVSFFSSVPLTNEDASLTTTVVAAEIEPPEERSEFWYVEEGLITEAERVWLCNTVAHEYGAYFVPTEEKAKVVATVMNRLWYHDDYPDNIYSILAPGQYVTCITDYYCDRVTDDCIDAVTYYFNHQNEFGDIISFWGDGEWNHFS